jgi:hypothetical protein
MKNLGDTVKYWARAFFLLLMFGLQIIGTQSPPEKAPPLVFTTVSELSASGGPVFGFDQNNWRVAGFDKGRWS